MSADVSLVKGKASSPDLEPAYPPLMYSTLKKTPFFSFVISETVKALLLWKRTRMQLKKPSKIKIAEVDVSESRQTMKVRKRFSNGMEVRNEITDCYGHISRI